MKDTFLWALLAAAIPLAAAQESRPSLAATAGDRAELLSLFDKPGQLGVIQVAPAMPAAATTSPLFPRYAGFDAELGFAAPAPLSRIERVRPAAPAPDGIEVPGDLRDAVAGVPGLPPGMTQVAPSTILKTATPAAPTALVRKAASTEPAGWLIITRKIGREIRPLNTAQDVARWAAAAELQRRAYESFLTERFANNLSLLGK